MITSAVHTETNRVRGSRFPLSHPDVRSVMEYGVEFRAAKLARADVFRLLGQAFLVDLADVSEYQCLSSDTLLLRQGDIPKHIFVVVGGKIRVSMPLYDGRDFIFSDVGPGGVFDLGTLFVQQESMMNVATVSESAVLRIKSAYLLKLFERRPDVAFKVIPSLCRAVNDARKRVIDATASLLPARLASTLLRVAADPHGIQLSGVDPVTIHISQTDLAAMVPASREKVNRCLREWQRRRITRYENGGVTILNFDALESIALHSQRTTAWNLRPARQRSSSEPGLNPFA